MNNHIIKKGYKSFLIDYNSSRSLHSINKALTTWVKFPKLEVLFER